MQPSEKQPGVLWLSIPLLLTVASASIYGLSTPDFYFRETTNWELQSYGQDLIDLVLICPVLFIAAVLTYRGSRKAMFVWAGASMYFVYTFVIYAFAVHFNAMFLLYCPALGLSFYSMLYFIAWLDKTDLTVNHATRRITRITAIYFFFISIAFIGLWLSAIIPDLRSTSIPPSLVETGLRTNPVHVIDLAVFLPGIFVTGILLWRHNPLGIALAPVVLTFFVLMNITIGFLHIRMMQEGMAGNPVLIYIMGVLALWSIYLLYSVFYKR
jgi:hypothetical protein